MRKKLSWILVLSLLLLLLPQKAAQAALSPDRLLRIGLYYGEDALPSANLQNVTGLGSGYQVGWLDASDTFYALGYLANVYLTVFPDDSVHLQSELRFADFEEAAAYAATLGNNAFPAYEDGGYYVRFGNFSSYYEAQEMASLYYCTIREGSPTGYTVRDTNSGATLFEFDLSGERLVIRPVLDAFSGNEGAQTWFKGRKYYGSFAYGRDGSGIAVSNVVSMEDYIRGVIPYEMSPSWPLEALKAQAVCARTYAYANLRKHSRYGFDLCNTTDCQVYFGTNGASERTDQAVTETAGQVVMYQGELIDAVYYASNGGASEDSENVWTKALPYLRAVRDDFERQTNVSHTDWSYELTLSDITNILRDRGNAITGSIVHAYATYTDAGNMESLTFIDSAGKKLVYEGERCRSVFNVDGYRIHVYSQRFLFEDKYHMRIQSNAEITNLSSGSLGAAGGGVYGTRLISASSVLTADGTVWGGEKYDTAVPVITANGTDTAEILTTISGASGFTMNEHADSTGSTSSVISADTLPIPDSCSGTFVIRGSGNGHNVGLSQYGAKAMAELSYTYDQILTYYYTGVSIQTADPFTIL